MNEKTECLKLAIEYARIWNENNRGHYKTEQGIVFIAKVFYDFIKEQ